MSLLNILERVQQPRDKLANREGPVPRYSKSTALVSHEHAAKLKARRRGDVEALAERGRQALKELRAAGKTGQSGLKSLDARLQASNRMRGVRRPDLEDVPEAEIEIVIRWLLGNQTTDQIAKATGLHKNYVHRWLRRIFGVDPRSNMQRVLGDIVSDGWLESLQRRFGDIFRSQLARPLGVPGSRLYSISRRRKALALAGQSAQRLIRLERDVLGLLFKDKGKQPHHLRAAVPDLHGKYEAAYDAIEMLRNAAERDVLPKYQVARWNGKASFVGREPELDALIEQLCAESQKDVGQDGLQSRARTILLWIPDILSWLGKCKGKLSRNKLAVLDRKSSALALEFLAADYYTKSWVVQRALANGLATDLSIIRSIIATSFRAWPERKKAGHTPGSMKDERSKAYQMVGRAVEEAIPRFGEVLRRRRSLPKPIRENAERLREQLRNAGFSPEQINAGISAKNPKIAARWFVANQQDWNLSFDAVAKYHQVFTRNKK